MSSIIICGPGETPVQKIHNACSEDMDSTFSSARHSASHLGAGALSRDTSTSGSAAVWQQQLGRDLNLDELHLLKHLASDGVGGCVNMSKSHVSGYGDPSDSHRNALLPVTEGNTEGVPLWQHGFDAANMSADATGAAGVGSISNNFSPAIAQPVTNPQNGFSANYGSQGVLYGGGSGNSGLQIADQELASQLAVNSLVGGIGMSSTAAAAAAASRGAFGEGPRIYVGGVPDLVTVAMVRDHFSRWGVVRDVHFPKERSSRRRRHFCFVTFESLQAAERAVAESNREIGGYPVAAINIPTDRLTHYGLRQGGLAPALPTSPLRVSSMYGSVGATVPDIGFGTSLRSVSLATTSADNDVTHQIGSQRVHSMHGSQPPLFPGSDSPIAVATQDEISAALAALRMGNPLNGKLGVLPSASNFSAGGSHALYQNGNFPVGDAQGFPLSHLNPAMQQHLLVLASGQGGGGSHPGSRSTSRLPSMESAPHRASSDGVLPSGPDPALSMLHMNGAPGCGPAPYPQADRMQNLSLGPASSLSPLLAHDLNNATAVGNGGQKQGSNSGGDAPGGSDSGLSRLRGLGTDYHAYADQANRNHNHNHHQNIGGSRSVGHNNIQSLEDRGVRSASFDTASMSMPWNSAIDRNNQVRSTRSSSVSPQGNRMSAGPATLPHAQFTNDSYLHHLHHVPPFHMSNFAPSTGATAAPVRTPTRQGSSLGGSPSQCRSGSLASSPAGAAGSGGNMASVVNSFHPQQVRGAFVSQMVAPPTQEAAMAGLLGFDHLASDRGVTGTINEN